jgi:hypothetical protein
MITKSYLGGHNVLTQPPRLYVRQLAIDAVKARKRAHRAQRDFDVEMERAQQNREALAYTILLVRRCPAARPRR